ncbi:hypothetical protein EVAR_6416_1 [Eumeta japonica]|uniref:Uncharacterized protein n=1 Tax=Eumeta variegata TaxID=151549 RepID=A0A4C1TDF6_EUMVA|nr:hypothetical protein EVAR_6416_1 [Eumeta japonica]
MVHTSGEALRESEGCPNYLRKLFNVLGTFGTAAGHIARGIDDRWRRECFRVAITNWSAQLAIPTRRLRIWYKLRATSGHRWPRTIRRENLGGRRSQPRWILRRFLESGRKISGSPGRKNPSAVVDEKKKRLAFVKVAPGPPAGRRRRRQSVTRVVRPISLHSSLPEKYEVATSTVLFHPESESSGGLLSLSISLLSVSIRYSIPSQKGRQRVYDFLKLQVSIGGGGYLLSDDWRAGLRSWRDTPDPHCQLLQRKHKHRINTPLFLNDFRYIAPDYIACTFVLRWHTNYQNPSDVKEHQATLRSLRGLANETPAHKSLNIKLIGRYGYDDKNHATESARRQSYKF